jgi:hemoglobin
VLVERAHERVSVHFPNWKRQGVAANVHHVSGRAATGRRPRRARETDMTTRSLYERLGGGDGITRLASDMVDNHLANPAVAARFAGRDIARLKNGAATFFISGTGGPNVYEGKDVLATHRGMNISAVEFMAALDDALMALAKNGIAQREQEEVLFILHSFRAHVVLV